MQQYISKTLKSMYQSIKQGFLHQNISDSSKKIKKHKHHLENPTRKPNKDKSTHQKFYDFLEQNHNIKHLDKKKLKRVFINRIHNKQKELGVHIKQKELNFQSDDQVKLTINECDIKCVICLDYFISPSCLQCGHIFCKLCIQKVFLHKKECPVCRKNTRIYKIMPIKCMVSFINHYIKDEQQQKTEHHKRLKEYLQLLNEQMLNFDSLKVEDKIDVRDLEYIWCVGVVKQKIQKNGTKYLLIHYDKMSEKFDELLDVKSERIAKLGSFTKRTDIPQYHFYQHQGRTLFQLINPYTGSNRIISNLLQTSQQFMFLNLMNDQYRRDEERNPDREPEVEDDLINNTENNGNESIALNREREFNEVPIHLDIGLNRNRDTSSLNPNQSDNQNNSNVNNMNSNPDLPVSPLNLQNNDSSSLNPFLNLTQNLMRLSQPEQLSFGISRSNVRRNVMNMNLDMYINPATNIARNEHTDLNRNESINLVRNEQTESNRNSQQSNSNRTNHQNPSNRNSQQNDAHSEISLNDLIMQNQDLPIMRVEFNNRSRQRIRRLVLEAWNPARRRESNSIQSQQPSEQNDQ